MDCDCVFTLGRATEMSWIHIAECKVNDCVIVQYEDVHGFYEYEVYRDDGTNQHIGWFESYDQAEDATRQA